MPDLTPEVSRKNAVPRFMRQVSIEAPSQPAEPESSQVHKKVGNQQICHV